LAAYIRLRWKRLMVTNTLTYYGVVLHADLKVLQQRALSTHLALVANIRLG
jgi:hypothetical protein